MIRRLRHQLEALIRDGHEPKDIYVYGRTEEFRSALHDQLDTDQHEILPKELFGLRIVYQHDPTAKCVVEIRKEGDHGGITVST
jgi:hypothetical protein